MSHPLSTVRPATIRRFLGRLCMAGLTAVAIGPGIACAQQKLDTEAMAKRVAPCMSCHGQEGRAAADGYYPRIAGKPAGYLYNQLINFRDGRRQQYPLMAYTVQHLSDAYLLDMARYFANLHVPYPPPQTTGALQATLERGQTLVTAGDPSRKIPACVSCHGVSLTGVAPSIPGLLGLPRDYINAQFGAWRQGTRRAAAPDCMADIAKQLSPEDISAISTWLSAQPVPADPAPAPSLPGTLPIPCGSFPQ